MQEVLGDSLFRVGTFPEAELALREPERHHDPVRSADLLRKQAEVAQRPNHLSPALRTLSRAMTLVEGRNDSVARAELSRLQGF